MGLIQINDTLLKFGMQQWLFFIGMMLFFSLFIIFVMFISYKIGLKIWEKRNWNFKIDEELIIRESNTGIISIPRNTIKKINYIKKLGLYILGDKKKIFIPEQIEQYDIILKEIYDKEGNVIKNKNKFYLIFFLILFIISIIGIKFNTDSTKINSINITDNIELNYNKYIWKEVKEDNLILIANTEKGYKYVTIWIDSLPFEDLDKAIKTIIEGIKKSGGKFISTSKLNKNGIDYFLLSYSNIIDGKETFYSGFVFSYKGKQVYINMFGYDLNDINNDLNNFIDDMIMN
ncbi:MAG: hypothetical protein WC850_05950 [Candidatus Gracilibacteria bacterium]